MHSSSRWLVVFAALALPFAWGCSSESQSIGSTSQAASADAGCCAEISPTDVPSCHINEDCCSNVCTSAHLCAQASKGGYCGSNLDCLSGDCVGDAGQLGTCH